MLIRPKLQPLTITLCNSHEKTCVLNPKRVATNYAPPPPPPNGLERRHHGTVRVIVYYSDSTNLRGNHGNCIKSNKLPVDSGIAKQQPCSTFTESIMTIPGGREGEYGTGTNSPSYVYAMHLLLSHHRFNPF